MVSSAATAQKPRRTTRFWISMRPRQRDVIGEARVLDQCAHIPGDSVAWFCCGLNFQPVRLCHDRGLGFRELG